jgi:hypothetical protein
MLTITVNSTEVVNTLDNLAARQMPFATARAINAVGVDFEQAQRQRMHQVFRIRGNPLFLELQGVKFLDGFATKGHESITMGIDPKADFLSKFETGEAKTATKGPFVATPDDIRSDPMTILSEAQRPVALFADQKANQVFEIRPGANARLLPGIWQRSGKGGLQRLFALSQSVPIPADLEFEDTARKTVDTMWAQRFSEAFEYALSKAKENGAEIDARPHDTSTQ